MGLQPSDFTEEDLVRPLPTGFTYRARAEIAGFELEPDVAAELNRLLLHIDRYHQRSDAETQGWPMD
jgi:hypothetical protein